MALAECPLALLLTPQANGKIDPRETIGALGPVLALTTQGARRPGSASGKRERVEVAVVGAHVDHAVGDRG
jgi:hypothetical protein